MKHAILCVDDEVDSVDALERLFRQKYDVYKATSGAEGLELLKKQDVSVIISDQKMPHMSGVEFLQKSKETHPETMRILLTGYTDIDSVIGAINAGEVYRYITKPWDPVDLVNTVDAAVEKLNLRRELKEKNEALEKAYQELKTLDEAKNHFMVLINHELKTPLTTLSSFLQLLENTELSKEQHKYVQRLSQSTDRLNKLISDVLELVSAETGLLKTNFETTSTRTLLTGVEAPFRESAAGKNQDFVLDIEDHELEVDSAVIQSVLTRLIDNAIKFGDSGSTISLAAHQVNGGKIQISVTNQGKPPDPATIEKILQPFSLDEDIMHHSQGTGLGLSLCRALLKTHTSELHLEPGDNNLKASFFLPSTANSDSSNN